MPRITDDGDAPVPVLVDGHDEEVRLEDTPRQVARPAADPLPEVALHGRALVRGRVRAAAVQHALHLGEEEVRVDVEPRPVEVQNEIVAAR